MKLKEDFELIYEEEITDFLNLDRMSYGYRKFIVDSFEELTSVLEKDIKDNTPLPFEKINRELMKIAGGGSGFQYDMILYMLYRYWYYAPLIIRKE